MDSTNEDRQIKELMAQVFPGYDDFGVDSVTPSITGEEPVVSFMVVCNEEAAGIFWTTRRSPLKSFQTSWKTATVRDKICICGLNLPFPSLLYSSLQPLKPATRNKPTLSGF